jgi:hypothetical protein
MAAALIGVPVTITSCGGDDPTGPPPAGNGDVTGSATGGGHTHTGVITKAQLDAGMAVTITFTGGGHTHDLPLTSTEVMQIAQGTRVQKDFTDFLHPHTYTFN